MAVKQCLAAAAGPGTGWGSMDKVTGIMECVLLSHHDRLGRDGQQLSPTMEAGDQLGRKARAGLVSSSSSRSSRLLPDP